MQDFTMVYTSEEDREYLVLELCYKTQRLLQISKEDGDAPLLIRFLTDLYLLKDDVKFVFPLDEFETALTRAKAIFLRERTESESRRK